MALLYPKTVSYSFLMSVHFPLKRYTSVYRKGDRNFDHRVASLPRQAFEGLEPYDGNLSRTVLRRLGVSNDPRLPGFLNAKGRPQGVVPVFLFLSESYQLDSIFFLWQE